MTEHSWVLEHIAGYVIGGLELEERERLEQHTAGCAACGLALADALRLDRSLESLFAPVRPEAALEDRLIQSLRVVPQRRSPRLLLKVFLGAAAVLLVGVLARASAAWPLGEDCPFPACRSSNPYPGVKTTRCNGDSRRERRVMES